MQKTFDHEKLHVYQRALRFYAEVDELVDDWDSRHAIRDHLLRAAESAVEQLARANAAPYGRRSDILNFSLGSVLECGACLDIAKVKALAEPQYLTEQKCELVEIFKMLMGLRRTWGARRTREKPANYKAGDPHEGNVSRFYHEKLELYQIALQLVRWFVGQDPLENLPSRLFRKLDASLTSILLNIAEGNGRFTGADKQRFLKTSYESCIKTASLLDLCGMKGVFAAESVSQAKEKLGSVTRMTASMAGVGDE